MSASPIRYREHRPGPALRADVECLWMVSDDRARAARPMDRVVPDACPEIIVHLGDPFSRRVGARWVRQPRAFLAGTLSRPWLLRGGRRLRTLGIRFRPGAVTRRFAIDMSAAADRELPLAGVAGAAAASALVAAVRAATDEASAIAAAELWLMERAPRARRADVTTPAVRAILRARGRSRIADVAAELGVHPRRLERAFARDLGIRPKLFARIVRLNGALAALGAGERLHAIDWALEAGYFDQSHLLRDFRVVAGRRGRAARDQDGELARHFTDPKRLRALLDGE